MCGQAGFATNLASVTIFSMASMAMANRASWHAYRRPRLRSREQEPPRCRPRRGGPLCQHGKPASCGRRHEPADILIGQPLCSECFAYHAAVPALWNQTARALPSVLAISRRQLRDSVRLSFGKVIEYQHRGLIHVHAVIRTDGPQGPDDAPPVWCQAAPRRPPPLSHRGPCPIRARPAPSPCDGETSSTFGPSAAASPGSWTTARSPPT